MRARGSFLLPGVASGVVLFLAIAPGCDGRPLGLADSSVVDAPPGDAAPDDASDGGAGDDAGDAPSSPDIPAGSSQIYGPCTSDASCEEGLTCRTEAMAGYPGGECNRTCSSDEDCVLRPADGSAPVDGWCPPSVNGAPRTCMRVCTNGIDCERPGYTCRAFNQGQRNEVDACIPVCTEESCVHGTTCDRESNRCRPAGAMPAGRTLGQTCQPATRMGSAPPPPAMQCRSTLCQPDWTPDSRGNRSYTGWNGGYCVARCILPSGYNSSTFWDEMELPQANCPDDGVCLAFNGSLSRGDLGTCYRECAANDDCRASDGYYCQKQVRLSATNIRRYQNGFCVPVNCASAATPCPMGLTCRRNTDGTGTCVPPATSP